MNRKEKRGGEVSIQVRSSLNAERIQDFSVITIKFEVVAVQNDSNIFCAIYHSPEGNVSGFITFLCQLLDFVTLKKYHLFLCLLRAYCI